MTQPATELDVVESVSPVRYTIATLVASHREYRAMLDSFEAAGFRAPECEFLFVDNCQGNKCDAYAGINGFLHKSRGEYLILCHQDVRLLDDGRSRLDRVIADIGDSDPRWALLGNAGGTSLGRLAMRITDAYGSDRKEGNLPARVRSLDENFIVVRRATNLGLSCDLDGFHMYGTDLCMIARTLGYSAYAVDFHLNHACSRNPNRLDREFYQARSRWVEKYQKLHSPQWIQTTCTPLYVSASRSRNAILNRLVLLCEKPLRKIIRFGDKLSGRRPVWRN